MFKCVYKIRNADILEFRTNNDSHYHFDGILRVIDDAFTVLMSGPVKNSFHLQIQ